MPLLYFLLLYVLYIKTGYISDVAGPLMKASVYLVGQPVSYFLMLG